MAKRRVLFVCRDNAAGSQMAEALLRAADDTHYEAVSAGIWASALDPLAVYAMAERGIDISGQRSKALRDVIGAGEFDYTITLGEGAAQRPPELPGMGRRLHWSLPEPRIVDRSLADQLHTLRTVRDTCDASIRLWLDKTDKEKEEDTDPVLLAS